MKKRIMRTILTMAAAAILSAFTLGAQAASDRWQSTTARNTDNDIQIDFKEVQVTLPQSWSGKCQMGVSENSVTFYQTKSRKLWEQEGYTSGGRLFSIGFSSDGSYKDNPSYMTIVGLPRVLIMHRSQQTYRLTPRIRRHTRNFPPWQMIWSG